MAVSRRQKENETFNDIASTLPIEENAKELDKASVLRLAIHYLKLKDVLADCEEPATDLSDIEAENPDAKLQKLVPNFSKDVLQALDGFLMMVSKDGRILYATDSISQYLGLRQVDVIGVHLQDIIHPQDYSEVATIFQSQGHDIGPEIEVLCKDPLRRNFVVRMRCAFTPSVRSITRCSNFKPIYCSGFLKFSNKKIKEGEFIGMVMLCKLASVMKVKELCVGAFFKTKHGLDLGYTAVDTRIRWILGFDPAEMIGLKAYNYFHPEDLTATSSCHTTLLAKGQSHSPCYRFMTRSGDWVWVKSKSCVMYDAMTHLPNGLSIYTWIVRYDEEDDRMKAIAAGDDPGKLGIKDTSSLISNLSSSSGCLKIKELCNTRSLPKKQQQTTCSNNNMISPEVIKLPPPNINPFQSSPPQTLSPSSTSSGVTSDPFMGVSPISSLNGCNSVQVPPSVYPSQMDLNELSPPYLSNSSVGGNMSNGYITPLTSPSNCSSPPDSCYYGNGGRGNYNTSPAHSPFPLPPFSMPPPQTSHGYNDYNSGVFPYGRVSTQQPSIPQSSFAVDSTVYISPNDYMSQSFMLGGQPLPHSSSEYNIKQEPKYFQSTDYSNCYYGDSGFNKTTPTSTRVKDARSRYINIGKISSGARSHQPMTDLDAIAINDISEWLQHSVH